MGEHDDFQQRFDQLYHRLRDELLSTFTPPSDQGTSLLPVITPQATSDAFRPSVYQPDGRDAETLHARIDGWCEDRPVHQLSDEDGRD